ncbi:MAG: N-acetyl-gamma-glutamyl-phosphate reductase [Actinomycetota bacterium]
MALTATVLGASGFSGGEVLRLLSSHPALEIAAAAAGARAGDPVASVLPYMGGLDAPELAPLADVTARDSDVCFSALPSGRLPAILDEISAAVVVDLSDDFRDGTDGWAYGLTEFARGEIDGSARIANPGCYPTASLLGLVPFARTGLIRAPIVIDALSGASGAGRRNEDRLLHAVVDGNATAYGTTEHRHVAEIERGLERFAGARMRVSFTPHIVPMARGLLVTARAPLAEPLDDRRALEVLEDFYASEPLVYVTSDWPQTKAVAATNRAHLSARVDGRNALLILSCAIDNLGKGAAGQAIQNANLALGLEETTGLTFVGAWP